MKSAAAGGAVLCLLLAAQPPAQCADSLYRTLSHERFHQRMAQRLEDVQPPSLSRAQALADLKALEQAAQRVWRGRWDGGPHSPDIAWILPRAAADVPNGRISIASFTAIAEIYTNTLNDKHAYVMSAGDELGNISEPASPLRWQRLSADIGLIRVDRFPESDEPFGEAFPEMVDRAFAGLRDTKGLILDLRGNAGGDPNQADRFYDYLSSSTLFLYFEVVRRSDAFLAYEDPDKLGRWSWKPDGFSKPFRQTYATQKTPFLYKGRVLVLADKKTVSAAEYFLSALLDNGLARFAGQRTPGHSGSVIPVELPNSRLVIALPVQHVLRRDMSTLEDRGLKPDYPLDPRDPDILKHASELLRKLIEESATARLKN